MTAMSQRVLIVEKQHETIRLLRVVFEYMDESWDIIQVLSGEEALLEMRLQPVDLVISEVRLPGMNGYELIDQVRRIRSDLKAIILTESGQAIPATANGQANGLISKPLDPETIGALIGEVLDQPIRPREQTPEVIDQLEMSTPQAAEESTDMAEQSSSGLIADLLSGLRKELGAHSVGMLSDSGQIGLQAGDFPVVAQGGHLTQAMMSVFSAGQKISQLLSQPAAENLLQFRGRDYHLVMAQVGVTYSLVLFLDSQASQEIHDRLPIVLRPVIDDLLSVLTDLGVPLESYKPTGIVPPFVTDVDALPDEDPDDDSLDDEMGALFDGAEDDTDGDLDSFWEPGDDPEDTTNLIRSDALSFQQAQQLGLTPPDEDEEV